MYWAQKKVPATEQDQWAGTAWYFFEGSLRLVIVAHTFL